VQWNMKNEEPFIELGHSSVLIWDSDPPEVSKQLFEQDQIAHLEPSFHPELTFVSS
jgi:hypothetical protein